MKKNPFITSTSVYKNDVFFGRHEVLNAVDKFIEQPNEHNLFIAGQRRIGKTSVLKRINKAYDTNDNKSIYITLQGDATTSLSVLLAKIALMIADKLNINKIIDNQLLETDFLNFLLEIKNSLKTDKKLILLFDEFDVLGEPENNNARENKYSYHKFVDFIPIITQDIENKKIPLKLIFAIGRNYKELDHARFGQIPKFSKQTEISFFPKKIVLDLLELADKIIPFTDKAKQKIWKITNGQPYFTQCLANVAFENAQLNNLKTINENDVETSLLPTIKAYRSAVFWIWNTLTNTDKIILFLIALFICTNNNLPTEKDIINIARENNFLPATTNLDKTITRLIDINFINKTKNNQLIFKSEFFQKWINLQIKPNDLKKMFVEH